jgi:hypothetical protein
MIQQVNERVTLQARKYVYGLDDAQLRFVSKRLGKQYTSNLVPPRLLRFARLSRRPGVRCTLSRVHLAQCETEHIQGIIWSYRVTDAP